jgi:hypothetical protein
MDKEIVCGCELVSGALEGDSAAVAQYMSALCGVLVPLLSSPLASPRICPLFIHLGQSVFDDSLLGKCGWNCPPSV